ncbi:MAG: hypothetical protein K1W21_05990, partial [Oscillospiraceae bacterium]
PMGRRGCSGGLHTAGQRRGPAGVEALEWKVKGLSGADIAQLYGAKPNQVGAWISRATQKIRKDVVEDRLPHL